MVVQMDDLCWDRLHWDVDFPGPKMPEPRPSDPDDSRRVIGPPDPGLLLLHLESLHWGQERRQLHHLGFAERRDGAPLRGDVQGQPLARPLTQDRGGAGNGVFARTTTGSTSTSLAQRIRQLWRSLSQSAGTPKTASKGSNEN